MALPFQRVNPLGDGIIRGPARLLVAASTQAYPANIGAIINMPNDSTTATPAGSVWTPTAEVQSLATSGTPTGGTFQLSFQSVLTSSLNYNATSVQVQAALQALPGIGAGGVTCTGGPLPTAIVITFAGSLATGAQPLILAPASVNALTGGTTPAAAVTRTTAGIGLWDPASGWTELGSTKTGVGIDRNNTETQLDVDQILGALTSIPDSWEMTVTTAFAETTLENIQLAWEGGTITTDTTKSPNQRHLPMGAPLSYTLRRLAVLHQKTIGPSAGKIRAHVFRSVNRSPQNSRITFNKTGEQQTVPQVFRAFADPLIQDPSARFGEILEEQFA